MNHLGPYGSFIDQNLSHLKKRVQISVCLQAAPLFLLGLDEATELVAGQIKAIKTFWKDVCEEAALSEVDRNFLWGRQFLNPFAFVDAPDALVKLADSQSQAWQRGTLQSALTYEVDRATRSCIRSPSAIGTPAPIM